MKQRNGKSRIIFLDSIRGISVVEMVVYHLMYDLVYLWNCNISWFSIEQCRIWQRSIVWTFLLISGISYHFSKNHWKRGGILLLLASLLWMCTAVFLPSETILYGVLHFLGTAILITAAIALVLKRIPPIPGIAVCLFAAFLFQNISTGKIGIGSITTILPSWLYSSKWTFWLGFPDQGFYSADYVPLLPWIFVFWCGYFLWSAISEKQKEWLSHLPAEPFFSFIGRHSLFIYMLHQPLLYGCLFLLDKCGVL